MQWVLRVRHGEFVLEDWRVTTVRPRNRPAGPVHGRRGDTQTVKQNV